MSLSKTCGKKWVYYTSAKNLHDASGVKPVKGHHHFFSDAVEMRLRAMQPSQIVNDTMRHIQTNCSPLNILQQ